MKNSHKEFLKRKKKSNARAGLVLLIVALLLILGCGLKKALAPVVQEPQKTREAVQTPQQEEKLPDPKDTTQPHDYSILIKKGKFTLYLLDKGKAVGHWNVALGKNSGQKEKSGDMKTPTGTFPVDEIIDASGWSHDFGDGKGEIPHAYGPWFISLDTSKLSKGKWDGIGIHGTHDPSSIGTRASEGCIRLNNQDLVILKAYVKVGTKVVIEE